MLLTCFLLSLSLISDESSTPPINAETVNAFLDDFWKKNAIAPGLSVAVSHDGTLLTARGFGMADPVGGKFVDAENTAFRVASVSKPLTAACVLKLVDEGKLKLDIDVNSYLKRVKIPEKFGKPITLTHLLTHTAGFEDKNFGTAAPSAGKVMSLEKYLLSNIPERVLPPGVAIAYSNQGYAIAGLVVQDVAGVPFEDFANEQIFKPLGMANTSFVPRDDLMKRLALGHEIIRWSYISQPFDFLHCAPPGGVLTTGPDYSKFLNALLTGKSKDGSAFLSESSLQFMRDSQFRHHPKMAGWTLGFWERRQGKLIGFGHGGDLRGYAADVSVWPTEKLAIFVAYNCAEDRGDSLRDRFQREFLTHFVPAARVPVSPSSAQKSDPDPIVQRAQFFGARRNQSGLDKLAILAGVVQVVSAGWTADGDLVLGNKTWKKIDTHLYQSIDGRLAAIRPADSNTPEMLFIGTNALDRSAWYDDITLQISLIGLAVAVSLLSIAIGLGGKIRQWFGGTPTGLRMFWTLSALAGFFLLISAGGLQLASTSIPKYDFTHGPPTSVLVVLVCFHVAALLCLFSIVACIVAWMKGRGVLLARLLAVVVAAGQSSFLWIAWHWNILGFHI
jgi:CubicO group peptidase (beta-lactamase class C family)